MKKRKQQVLGNTEDDFHSLTQSTDPPQTIVTNRGLFWAHNRGTLDCNSSKDGSDWMDKDGC